MAINGADAIRPLNPGIRVTPARPTGSQETPKRKSDTAAKTVEKKPPPPRREPPDFSGRALAFRHDEELNRVIVEVIDAKTREVVRTIPPEEIVNVLKSIRRAQGALLDEEA